jgi:transposase InsO family protein
MDRAWVGDITFIATGSGWLYLAVLLDLYSRRVVGWAMSERIRQQLVLDALKIGVGAMAYATWTDSSRIPQLVMKTFGRRQSDCRLRL